VEAPAALLLHAWHTLPDYLNPDGQPMALHYQKGEKNFKGLVARVVGDIPAGAIKVELKRIAAIEEDGEQRLVAIKSHYVPEGIDEKAQHGLEIAIRYLADTIAFDTNPDATNDARFERVVTVAAVDPVCYAELQKRSKEMLERFAVEYDDYLVALERDHRNRKVNNVVGAGFYYFQIEEKGR